MYIESDSDPCVLDAQDAFKPLTDQFDMPYHNQQQKLVYLNGNSLGPKPKGMEQRLQQQCDLWARLGVRGHFDGKDPWIYYHQRILPQLARLTGATSKEVVAMGTLTSNLHAALVSFYRPTRARYKIIRLAGFPSDTYAIRSQVQQRLETIYAFSEEMPFSLEEAIIEIKPDDNDYISLEKIEETLATHGHQTAVVWLEAVHYLTGQYFDMKTITKLAHQYGCTIGFDLAHAIGNVPLELHDWDVDFAVWCSYKYISAGPGAMGGLYIHERYVTDPNIPKLLGWWGNHARSRFKMSPHFDPILTAESWQLSNPTLFAMSALYEALCIYDQVDLGLLRKKNERLTAYAEELIKRYFSDVITIITPKNPQERGCQLSLKFKSNHCMEHLETQLLNQGVLCDVRGEVIRIAPVGLYNTYQDIHFFIQTLKLILDKRS